MTFFPFVLYWYGFNSRLKLRPHPSWLLQPLSVYHPLTTHKPQYTKAQYCVSSMCQDFKHILSSSLLLLKSTLKQSCGDVCASLCVCCECENICKCVAWLSSQGSAWNPPCADTQGWEAVSTTQPLAAEEVTLIMSCQCLEIRVSTAISYPACVCVLCLHPCACVYVSASQGRNAEELRR